MVDPSTLVEGFLFFLVMIYYVGVSVKFCSPHTHIEYNEFQSMADPFGMSGELAAARALIVEFRQAIEANSKEMVAEFLRRLQMTVHSAVVSCLGHAMGVPDEDRAADRRLQSMAQAVAGSVEGQTLWHYQEIFGEIGRISPEQARTMAQLLKTSGDVAEKWRKAAEETTLRVVYDAQTLEMMAKFLALSVLPYVDSRQKEIIGYQAAQFLGALPLSGEAFGDRG